MSRVDRQRHKIKLMGKQWTPWKEIPVTGEYRASAPHLQNVSRVWANSRFEVSGFEVKSPVGGIWQLVVARHGHLEQVSWNDLQRIKTELFGEGNFAIEIYPPQAVNVEMKVRIIWIMPSDYQPPCGLHLESAWGGQ